MMKQTNGFSCTDGEQTELCKLKANMPLAAIAVLSAAGVAFIIVICLRPAQQRQSKVYATQRILQTPNDGFPKIEKAGMYYDRVMGKWVEDVDFSPRADGRILHVVMPDPGGRPNIPYDELNTTDIPMPGSQPQLYNYNQANTIMIPPQFSHRRQLTPWYGRPMPQPGQQGFPGHMYPPPPPPPQAQRGSGMMVPAFFINPYWQNNGGMSSVYTGLTTMGVFPGQQLEMIPSMSSGLQNKRFSQ